MSTLFPRLEFLFQALYKSQNKCPHCKSTQLKVIAKKFYLVKIKRCKECRLCFTSPIYKTYFSNNFYDAFYQAEGSTTSMPDNDTLKRMKEKSFKGYDKYFGDRIRAIKSMCTSKDILELGSSWGYFLYQAKKQGFDTIGVEIANTRRNFGIKNLNVTIVDSFDKLNNKKFDVIYTAHVLEHFTDLSEIFSQLNKHSKIGTKLIIEVPNFDFEQFGAIALSNIGAIHPIGFDSEFFGRNLPKYGFEKINFFDSWSDVPDSPKEKSSIRSSVILIAECTHEN